MLTLLLQGIIAACMLVFAGMSAAIARRLPVRAGVFRTTWVLAAISFGFYAAIMAVQAVAAVAAFSVGRGHAVFEWYMTFSPMANHARTFLLWPFYAALGLIVWRGALSASGVRWTISSIVIGGLVGAMYGRWEGALHSTIHLPTTALIDSMAFVVLGAVLIASLIRDTLDRHLWSILAIHGLNSAVAAIFLTAMLWIDVAEGWTPAPWHLAAVRLVFFAAMVAIAANRFLRVSRGEIGRSMLAPSGPGGMIAH
jgi:hypothetical protein